MFRVSLVSLFFGCSLLIAQDDEKLTSGPKAGTFLPAPFECYNVNGPAKGRQHCLVCKFALSPVVMIFAKEQPADKDTALTDLIKQLDEAAEEFQDREFSVGVVFLSPDAKNSTNNAEEKDPKKLIEETIKREELVEKLKARGDKLKHAVLAYYLPDGPKAYKLNPKADVTILFYERMKIKENWAFGPGGLQEEQVKTIVERVRDAVPIKKKDAKEPKT